MPEWTTACPDWAERLRSGPSIIPPPIFPEQSEQAITVFKSLRIVDAPGSPTFGEACDQWVFDLVASIFGANDEKAGRRLITEWFVLVPKKNMKSTLAAGVMMTAQVLNWRQSAEFSIIAPTVEIANNSFGPARNMCSAKYGARAADAGPGPAAGLRQRATLPHEDSPRTRAAPWRAIFPWRVYHRTEPLAP